MALQRPRSEQRMKKWRNALVVVPDDTLRAVVVELLTQEHFVAFDVRTLAEAHDVLRSRAPQLVIVDPGLGQGDDLSALLSSLERRGLLSSVVLISDRPSVTELAQKRCVVCVREPFELDELMVEIARATLAAADRKSG